MIQAQREHTARELHGYTADELWAVAALGYTLYQHSQLKDARIIFEGLSAIDPSQEYFARGLAAVCLLMGDFAVALEAINRALNLSQDPGRGLMLRAQIRIARREFMLAGRDLRRLLLNDCDPTLQELAQGILLLIASRATDSFAAHRPAASGSKEGV